MSSLRSSSALAVNVFDPWRGLSLEPIAAALNVTGKVTELRFEQRLPHGLASNPPNLDLVLFREHGVPVGIESKFCDPYGRPKEQPPIDSKYFVGNFTRWSDVGLPACQTVAASVGREERFCRLSVGQLLKHILALARTFGVGGEVTLIYLWFDSRSTEADEHRLEIERFRSQIDRSIDFRSVTYQDFATRLKALTEPRPGYFTYLGDRYGLLR